MQDGHFKGQGTEPGVATAAAPWPDGYEPRTPGERRLWHSFEELRSDPGSDLNLRVVATRIGMSRTSIAWDGCPHKELRKAIIDEIDAREERRVEAETARAEAEPVRGRVLGVRHWQAVAQRADSRNAEYMARASRADRLSRRRTQLLRRFLEDIKAGRWQRVDVDAVTVAELSAELGVPADLADQP